VPCVATSCGGTTDGGVTVKIDMTAPVFSNCPTAPVHVEASGSFGGLYGDAGLVATDRQSYTIAYDPPPGARPMGSSTQHATATDEAGNSTPCDYTLEVSDTTAPALSCAKTVDLGATSDAGAVVPQGAYAVVVSDAVDPAPAIDAGIPEGGVVPFGTTVVTVTATDSSGNTSRCSIGVTVTVAPPTLSCPDTLDLKPDGPDGTTLPGDLGVTFSDPIDPSPTVEYSLKPGSPVPIGTTPVKVKVTNSAGKTSECTIAVVVSAIPVPAVSRYHFGCSAAPVPSLALVLGVLGWLALRRRR
jgi:uncharacterized protein (TIGR03382 family)